MRLFAAIGVITVLAGLCAGAYLLAATLGEHLEDEQEFANAKA